MLTYPYHQLTSSKLFHYGQEISQWPVYTIRKRRNTMFIRPPLKNPQTVIYRGCPYAGSKTARCQAFPINLTVKGGLFNYGTGDFSANLRV